MIGLAGPARLARLAGQGERPCGTGGTCGTCATCAFSACPASPLVPPVLQSLPSLFFQLFNFSTFCSAGSVPVCSAGEFDAISHESFTGFCGRFLRVCAGSYDQGGALLDVAPPDGTDVIERTAVASSLKQPVAVKGRDIRWGRSAFRPSPHRRSLPPPRRSS